MKMYYLGGFPPPYGGVTIKNKLLFDSLSKKIDVSHPDVGVKLPKKIRKILRLYVVFKRNVGFIIGMSAVKKSSLHITRLLYWTNRKAMKNSLYFMMGGLETGRISKSKKEIKMYSCYKKLYVETPSMLQQLIDCGMTNVAFFPNCRENANITPKNNTDEAFSCVFFSQVCLDKGVDMVISAAKKLPTITFDIYGEVQEAYKAAFFDEISDIPNLKYCGVFKSKNNSVYGKLSEYNLLLFPTRYKSEGVPGILAEAKIARLPVIATDVSHNAEIVEDNVDGILVPVDDEARFVKAISDLNHDRNKLNELQRGTIGTSKKYVLETYIDEIIRECK